MTSRRDILKGLAVGAAAAAVPATARATSGSSDEAFALPDGPAPWWLVAPLRAGSVLGLGWYLASLSAVRQGAAVLTLGHRSGRKARLHLCLHTGSPTGLAHTKLLDLVLMDGNTGVEATDEALGRVVLGLADKIAENELDPSGDLWEIAKMMTHKGRMETYGPETL